MSTFQHQSEKSPEHFSRPFFQKLLKSQQFHDQCIEELEDSILLKFRRLLKSPKKRSKGDVLTKELFWGFSKYFTCLSISIFPMLKDTSNRLSEENVNYLSMCGSESINFFEDMISGKNEKYFLTFLRLFLDPPEGYTKEKSKMRWFAIMIIDQLFLLDYENDDNYFFNIFTSNDDSIFENLFQKNYSKSLKILKHLNLRQPKYLLDIENWIEQRILLIIYHSTEQNGKNLEKFVEYGNFWLLIEKNIVDPSDLEHPTITNPYQHYALRIMYNFIKLFSKQEKEMKKDEDYQHEESFRKLEMIINSDIFIRIVFHIFEELSSREGFLSYAYDKFVAYQISLELFILTQSYRFIHRNKFWKNRFSKTCNFLFTTLQRFVFSEEVHEKPPTKKNWDEEEEEEEEGPREENNFVTCSFVLRAILEIMLLDVEQVKVYLITSVFSSEVSLFSFCSTFLNLSSSKTSPHCRDHGTVSYLSLVILYSLVKRFPRQFEPCIRINKGTRDTFYSLQYAMFERIETKFLQQPKREWIVVAFDPDRMGSVNDNNPNLPFRVSSVFHITTDRFNRYLWNDQKRMKLEFSLVSRLANGYISTNPFSPYFDITRGVAFNCDNYYRYYKYDSENDHLKLYEISEWGGLRESSLSWWVIMFLKKSQCHHCGIWKGERLKLKGGNKKKRRVRISVCGACKMVGFCGVECQKKNWKKHKVACKQSQISMRKKRKEMDIDSVISDMKERESKKNMKN